MTGAIFFLLLIPADAVDDNDDERGGHLNGKKDFGAARRTTNDVAGGGRMAAVSSLVRQWNNKTWEGWGSAWQWAAQLREVGHNFGGFQFQQLLPLPCNYTLTVRGSVLVFFFLVPPCHLFPMEGPPPDCQYTDEAGGCDCGK